MKIVLAMADEGVSGHQLLNYNDKWLNDTWNEVKDSYKHTSIIKSGDSTGSYAILETTSVKELMRFEEQFNVTSVVENKYNKQVPYILGVL